MTDEEIEDYLAHGWRAKQFAQAGLALVRKRMLLLALALAAALTAACPAIAQEQTAATSAHAIIGVGVADGGCGRWASSKEDSPLDIGFTSWLLGFTSGVNAVAVLSHRGDFLNGYDGWSLAPWAKQWCSKHPLDQVSSAADALIDELANRRYQNQK
jgi:hypothetical protein